MIQTPIEVQAMATTHMATNDKGTGTYEIIAQYIISLYLYNINFNFINKRPF